MSNYYIKDNGTYKDVTTLYEIYTSKPTNNLNTSVMEFKELPKFNNMYLLDNKNTMYYPFLLDQDIVKGSNIPYNFTTGNLIKKGAYRDLEFTSYSINYLKLPIKPKLIFTKNYSGELDWEDLTHLLTKTWDSDSLRILKVIGKFIALKYDITNNACYYCDTSTSFYYDKGISSSASWKKICDGHGIYFFLQAAGGSGADGNCFATVVANFCKGASGAGAGAFISGYLNLYKYYLLHQSDPVVYVYLGKAGKHLTDGDHVDVGGTSGNSGLGSYMGNWEEIKTLVTNASLADLSGENTIPVFAQGGKGGTLNNAGAGGKAYISHNSMSSKLESCIYSLKQIDGASGGNGGDLGGYTVGIPHGHKTAQVGKSCSTGGLIYGFPWLTIPSSGNTISVSSSKSTCKYLTGGSRCDFVNNAYSSEGGGGGASALSAGSASLNDFNWAGYGYGSNGGSADVWKVHAANQDGGSAAFLIF